MVAAHAGALGIVCLDMRAEGARYRLHAERPGASLNRVVRRADLPSGAASNIVPVEVPIAPSLIRVDISGPLEERAGYYGECGGYSDGHDAVCERLCAALAMGDVLLVIDSPGGAAAGLQQNVARAAAAKAHYGRRVTVYVNETCCSAAIWWAFGVGDEIYGPEAAQIGSIGARGAHQSIAGALAAEGVAIEYFCWPNMGKVALAPELPLSEEGRARGTRDIGILGRAFAAAVAESPLGQRFGLTIETIASLNADVFTGAYALTCPALDGQPRARLLDGVETLETVTEHALQLAESEEARAITDQAEAVQAAAQTGATRAQGERAMSLQTDAGAAAPNARAEGDEPDDDDSEDTRAAGPGTMPDGECKQCGSANDVSHKFCAQCGYSMAAPPIEVPADAEGDGDEPPPSSKAPPMTVAPAPAAMQAPKPVDASASLASILGASAESPLAIKTAAIALRQLRDTAAGVTGQTTTDSIIGSLLSMPDRLAAGDRAAEAAKAAAVKAKADAKAAAVKAEQTERLDLCRRGVATGAPSMAAGLVYVPRVSEQGTRTATDLAPMFAEMKIATLRGLVTGLEKSAPKRNPFEPSEDKAKAAADAAIPTPTLLDDKGEPTPAAMAVYSKHPVVTRLFDQPGNTRTIETIARTFIKTNANTLAIGGAQ